MNDFNYKKAWRDLSVPAYLELPKEVHDLISYMQTYTKHINQNEDLSLPWPENTQLKKSFENIPAEDLAKAARVVWSTGHWNPYNSNYIFKKDRGTYWKFAMYADQILREKCDLTHSKHCIINFEILEGFIRACIFFEDIWEWHEVALATPDNLNRLQKIANRNINSWDKIEAAIEEMKLLRPIQYEIKAYPYHHLVENKIACFFDLEEYCE